MAINHMVAEAVLEEALKLSVEERNILEMFYYDDLTIDDIATIMKLPRSKVSDLFANATNTLRNVIKTNDVGTLSLMG